MSKVLVLGTSPLPIENKTVHNGPGIRTWQFVRPLINDGHQICLVCLQTPGGYKQKESVLVKKKNKGNFIYYSLPQAKFEEISYIQKIHDSFKPDCIFSISSFLPSYSAVQLKTDKPIWFDRGDLMSEAQLKASVDNNDDYLYYFWKLEELVLERGDVFSSVSSHQKFVLIGRLGSAGRLNKHTLGHEFVYVIPCGIEKGNYSHTKNVIRGKHVNNDDFVVLWSGGYNTWADIKTLFSALEMVMAKNRKIKFVSTGGTIAGQNETTYPNFLKLIDSSKYKDRYIMLGWVLAKYLPDIYLESDLGINIDKYCYEVVLGSRHRLLDWMKASLPILTTKPSELTQILDREKIVFTCPNDDAKFLAEMILKLSSEKKMLAEYAQRAKDFAQNKFSYELTTEPFRKWVKSPKHAPDRIAKSKSRKYLDNIDKRFLHNIEAEYIDNLKRQINTITAEQNNLKQHISNLDTEHTNLKQHISNLDTERTNLKQHISNLDTERENLINDISNLEDERDNLKNHIAELDSKQDKLENKIKNLTEHLNNICNSRSFRLYMAIKKILHIKVG